MVENLEKSDPMCAKRPYILLTFFEKTTGIFRFVTFPFEIPDKMKFHPWNLKLCYTPLKFQGLKPKPMVEIPHDFFLSPMEIPPLFN